MLLALGGEQRHGSRIARPLVSCARPPADETMNEPTSMDPTQRNEEPDLSAAEQLVEARRQLREAKLELAATREDLARINQRLLEVLDSTSWKVTAPLRALGDTIKRLKGGGRPETETPVGAALPAATAEEATKVRRLYPEFDERVDRATRRESKQYLLEHPETADVLVSIIMPTHNRADLIEAAIDSVLAQSHQNWELLVIDDGSTDNTPEVMQAYAADTRIRYERLEKSGVGPARNRGIELARGDWFAFLDSDNRWDPEFLGTMIGGLARAGAKVGYSAIAISEGGAITGFRGDDFDFEECLQANYVDINSLVVHRSVIEAGHRFDPDIRRTSDWDFLLSVAWEFDPAYIPFVGVNYRADDDPSRITTAEPWLFRSIVQERHRRRARGNLPRPEPFATVLRSTPLDIIIRTAAHYHERFNWGDHYFAMGLAQAFERLGHKATVLYREIEPDHLPDVLIVLRGLSYYPPVPGTVNVIWSISHPDETELQEWAGFDIAAVASRPFATFLQVALQKPVHTIYQATDRARFFPRPHIQPGEHLLFVGNSREVFRPSIRNALETGHELVVYGSGWEGVIPTSSLRDRLIAGKRVGDEYAAAGAVLNDHWDSMRDFGYISNRLYDVIASGGIPVTDTFPDLERKFGDKVQTFSSSDDFGDAVKTALARRRDNGFAGALDVLNHDTLDERAGQILDLVYGHMSASAGQSEDLDDAPVRVAVVRPDGATPAWPDDGLTRVISPLTADLPEAVVQLSVVTPRSEPVASADALVIDSAAMTDPSTLRLVERYRASGRPVFLDAPDLDIDISMAGDLAAIWTSDSGALEGKVRQTERMVVVPDTLDPRLWRTYRRRAARSPGSVRVLIDLLTLGPESLERVEEGLSSMRDAVDDFEVWLLMRDPPRNAPPWIHALALPTEFQSAAEIARWIRDKGRMCDLALLIDSGQPLRRLLIAWLQYTALEVPVVVAGSRVLHHPVTGDPAGGDEWKTSLVSLLGDPELLSKESERARKLSEEMWSRNSCSLAGSKMLQSILDHL